MVCFPIICKSSSQILDYVTLHNHAKSMTDFFGFTTQFQTNALNSHYSNLKDMTVSVHALSLVLVPIIGRLVFYLSASFA